jgi:hypothetical protein
MTGRAATGSTTVRVAVGRLRRPTRFDQLTVSRSTAVIGA